MLERFSSLSDCVSISIADRDLVFQDFSLVLVQGMQRFARAVEGRIRG
jgi:hypothetical protein